MPQVAINLLLPHCIYRKTFAQSHLIKKREQVSTLKSIYYEHILHAYYHDDIISQYTEVYTQEEVQF